MQAKKLVVLMPLAYASGILSGGKGHEDWGTWMGNAGWGNGG